MITRLPFTLTPLEGEPFEVWLHAYAASLAMTPGRLAAALGLPGRPASGQVTEPPPERLVGVSAATGLAPARIAGMFAVAGPVPFPQYLAAWMPRPVTRFCPACLAAGPAAWPAAWRLPVTFFCLLHDQPLASKCPHCGTTPASRIWRAPAGPDQPPAACHAGPGGCGARLDLAIPPSCADSPAARRAQLAIGEMLATIRDPAAAPAGRRAALDGLTDLAITAFHVAAGGRPRRGSRPDPAMFGAATLTAAFALLTARDDGAGQDPVAGLAPVRTGRHDLPRAVPWSWARASAGLRARIAHSRDPRLPPVERLRHATALAAPSPAAPLPPGDPDPAVTRAARLPDQIWASWAIRLTDDTSARHVPFRPAVMAALLIPRSGLRLRQIIALAGGQGEHQALLHQLRKLAPGPGEGTAALRIITELALAIDSHDIPVSYRRRRELAAATTLIDDRAWARIARQAGLHAGRGRRAGLAGRYLYELITGGNLTTAPPPCQITSTAIQTEYNDFTLAITPELAAALHEHARRLLDAAGMAGEPVHWEPPASWVTVTTWPGADPDRTDPGPIHRGLSQNQPPTRVAADLGISVDHLRHVLRAHPLPLRRLPTQRVLMSGTKPAGQARQPGGVTYIDPAWLHEEYVTWHRPLTDLAAEIGCNPGTLKKFAHAQGITIRPRSGAGFTAAPGCHPRDLPEPLRQVLQRHNPQQRLHRLLAIAAHPTLTQAARTLGITEGGLSTQLRVLEAACGGPLLNRGPGTRPAATLTPLGEQLCQQARDYLGPATASPRT